MPKKCFKARVEFVENLAIITREDGGIATIPKDYLCKLAEKLNLCYENYKC